MRWMFRVLGTDKGREVSDWGVDVQGAGDTVRKTRRCQTRGWMFRVLGTHSETQGGVRLGGGCSKCSGHSHKEVSTRVDTCSGSWGHSHKHTEVSDLRKGVFRALRTQLEKHCKVSDSNGCVCEEGGRGSCQTRY